MSRPVSPSCLNMCKRYFSTLADENLREELRTTALAFLILTVIGFVGASFFSDVAETLTSLFTDKMESLDMAQLSGMELATTLFLNNFLAAFSAMLDGVIPFVFLSAAALGTNALLLGAFAAVYQQNGLSLLSYLVGILPHGIFELPAIILACTLGLMLCKVGTARILKRETPRTFRTQFRYGSRIFSRYVLPLLLLAALIEAYLTPRLLALVL